MEKILLALGYRELEDFLKKQLNKEYFFVGTAVYREAIIRAIGQKNPDVIIIRETLEGNENIMSIVYEIRTKFPKVRIIFIAGKREPGDALLSTLVSYGIYDILHGDKIQANEIIKLVRKKNVYNDVKHLQPVPILDERSNKISFEAPETIVKEKEIIREIYIDKTSGVQKTQEELNNDFKERDKESKIKNEELNNKSVDEKENKPFSIFDRFKKNSKESKECNEKDVQEFTESKIERYLENAENTKQKIVTFMGSKRGVGNTSIALNTAIFLAQKKNRVLYMELDEYSPAISYWYEIEYLKDGIDSALEGLKMKQYDKVNEAIIRSEDIKIKEGILQKNYKKFPDTLDFMFYSNNHIVKKKLCLNSNDTNLDYSLTKDLYLYLMLQCNYDYVILDVKPEIFNEDVINALIYSNKVFITITQDVSTIGGTIFNLNELSKKGINLGSKLYYIVNKYEKANLSLNDIMDWIQNKNILSIPCENKEYINANFIGLPVILSSKNSNIKNSFHSIGKILL